MRQTPVSVPLTILMFLLVLMAAFFFVLQGRNQLVRDRSSLRGQVATMESMLGLSGTELDDAMLALTMQAGQQADIKATITHTADNLTVQQQTVATYEEQMAKQKATITAQAIALATRKPSVEILKPQNNDLFQVGHPIEFLASVVDEEGLKSVELYVNKVLFRSYSAESTPTKHQIVNETWITEKEGKVTFDLIATNQNGSKTQQTMVVELSDLKSRLQPTIDEISAQIKALRGLSLPSPLRWRVLSRSGLEAEWKNRFTAEYTADTLRELRLKLYALDAVELEDDFETTLLNSYSSLVTGYYDLNAQELVVISNDQELSASEKVTLAHEIVHASQQQAFGVVLDSAESLNPDAALALRALAEGDATFTASLFQQSNYFTDEERQSILNEGLAKPDSLLSQLPPFFSKEQFFPYLEGTSFIKQLYEKGGFVAINRAWITPPTSTEQILHLDSYDKKDVPQLVTLPILTPTLGADWELVSNDVLGEFTLRNYLAQGRLNSAELAKAMLGWEGDRYAIYWNEKQKELIFVLKEIWNTPQDISEFSRIYATYAVQKYGTDGVVAANAQCWTGHDITCLYSLDDQTVIVRAPNKAIIDKIASNLNLSTAQP